MNKLAPKDGSASPDGSRSSHESPLKVGYTKGQTVVLVPQPSDDPKDPLVSTHRLRVKIIQEIRVLTDADLNSGRIGRCARSC